MEKPNNSLVFEGMVSVRALIDGAKNDPFARRIRTVLYAPERKEKNPKEYAYLSHRAEEGLFELKLCPKEEICALAAGSSHGGVVALCEAREYPALDALKAPEKGFYMMMEGLEDPFNFGYALRTIYAAGADGVILTGERTGSDGVVCRASAGASERMKIYRAEPEKAAAFFKNAGYKIVCADQKNAVSAFDADLSKPLLLVVGGEKRGITRAVLDACDEIVFLPYGRDFDQALSAASAASVFAYEVLRRDVENRKTSDPEKNRKSAKI